MITAPELVGFLAVAACAVALVVTDVRARRLPDRIVYSALAALFTCFVAGAIVRADATRLVTGILGALTLGAVYVVLAVLGHGRLGVGDIKLAVLIGLALGWFGWAALLVGALGAFLLNAMVTLALLAARRITLKSELPFGPFMLGSAGLIVLLNL